MKTPSKLICIATLGVLIAGGILGAGDDPKPAPYYLQQDDVQYFPAGPESKLAVAHQQKAVLGDLLFTDVVSVHFIGPDHPANPDGSLGGLVLGDFAEMKIYERYILREVTGPQGETYRELRAYETLGRIEQRFTSANTNAPQTKN